jgi:hypothetical protein
MSTSILRELAKRFKGKLSSCEIYDANICTSHFKADKPWELIPLSGEPFSRRLRFTYKGRRVTVLENKDYANGTVQGMFASRPFSINAKQRAGFRSEFARTLAVAGKRYAVFAETHRLSPDQEDILGRTELSSLVEESNLREGESLYFTQGEIGFYLKRPTADYVGRVVDRMVDLATKVEVPEEGLNLNLLPAQFHPLIPLIERWALSDDSDRDDLLDAARESILRALIDKVEPYLETIDLYLDSFREEPPSEQAAALGRLAECALEAKQRLSNKNESRIR